MIPLTCFDFGLSLEESVALITARFHGLSVTAAFMRSLKDRPLEEVRRLPAICLIPLACSSIFLLLVFFVLTLVAVVLVLVLNATHRSQGRLAGWLAG